MYQFLSILLAIVSILLTVYIIFQSRKFDKFQKNVARAQGVFKQRSIEMSIFRQKALRSFLIAAQIKRDRILMVPFVVEIRNSGEKTCEEVEIFFRANSALFFGGGAKFFTGPKPPKNLTVHQHESGSMISLSFSLSVIHPKQPIILALPVSIGLASIFEMKIPGTTKNGVDVVATAWAEVALILDCMVVQKDEEPMSQRFDLRIIDSRKDRIGNFFLEYNGIIAKSRREKSSKFSFFGWIRKVFTPRKMEKLQWPRDVGLIVVDDRKVKPVTVEDEKGKSHIYEAPKGSLKIYRGLEFRNGFLFPGLGVYPNTTDS